MQYLTVSWEDPKVDLNMIKDALQTRMNAFNATDFPCDNTRGTDIHTLCRELFKDESNKYYQIIKCRVCNLQLPSKQYTNYHWDITSTRKNSVAVAVRSYLHNTNKKCRCKEPLVSHIEFGSSSPPVIVLVMSQTMQISKTFSIKHNDISIRYILSGLVYYGGNHFTCRVFDKAGNCWYSDGAESGGTPINDGKMSNISNLHITRGRNISLAIYSIDVM